ncbi:hypothetical protein SGLAM104S_08798 [Streptomyces glaucescens]
MVGGDRAQHPHQPVEDATGGLLGHQVGLAVQAQPQSAAADGDQGERVVGWASRLRLPVTATPRMPPGRSFSAPMSSG